MSDSYINDDDLWYDLVKLRLIYMGVDVLNGEAIEGELATLDMSDPFNQFAVTWSCTERLMHDIILFSVEAEDRGELTVDVVDIMRQFWPRDLHLSEDEFQQKLVELDQIATKVEEPFLQQFWSQEDNGGSPKDGCHDNVISLFGHPSFKPKR